jgi:hypothetical protein
MRPLRSLKVTMLAFIVLLLAALSRLVPHANHAVAFNFTAVGAGLLFFGSRRPRWEAVVAVAVMALMDVYLTTQVYQFPFQLKGYLVTWAWYGAVCLMGSELLRKITALRVAAGVFASATSFFLLSNFMVWAGGGLYAHTLSGLGACYIAALPFYGNDLISTSLVSAVLFGSSVLAAQLSEPQLAHGRMQRAQVRK